MDRSDQPSRSAYEERPRSPHDTFFRWMRPISGLLIGAALLAFIYYFTSFFIELEWLWHTVSLVSFYIIYILIVLRFITFVVPADKAWIMINEWMPEIRKHDPSGKGFRKIHSQREYQSGFHWRFWWEKYFDEVDMARRIMVENKKNQIYTFKGGGTIEIKWRIPRTPMVDYVVNRHRTKDEDIDIWLETRGDQFLQSYIGNRAHVGFGEEEMQACREAFKFLFKGLDHIDEEEEAYGTWTGVPEIYYMSNPKDVTEAKNFKTIYAAINESARDAVKESGDRLSYDTAFRNACMLWAAQEAKDGGSLSFLDLTNAFAGRAGGVTRGKQQNNRQGGK